MRRQLAVWLIWLVWLTAGLFLYPLEFRAGWDELGNYLRWDLNPNFDFPTGYESRRALLWPYHLAISLSFLACRGYTEGPEILRSFRRKFSSGDVSAEIKPLNKFSRW